MKNYFLSLCVLFLNVYSYPVNQHPLTLIVHNTTEEDLKISLEYQLMQHYSKNEVVGTPFVPNNNQSYDLQIIKPHQKKTVSIFAYSPCAKSFCFLEKNLQTYGFKHHYKVIQGSITIANWERSYDFKEAVFDGGTLTCTIKPKVLSVSTTKSFYALNLFYNEASYTL